MCSSTECTLLIRPSGVDCADNVNVNGTVLLWGRTPDLVRDLVFCRPITLNGGYMMAGWSDITGLSESSPEDAAVSQCPHYSNSAKIQQSTPNQVGQRRSVLWFYL